MARIEVQLLENRLVVWDTEDGRKLFRMGFYGKPLGVPKPKDASFDAPLILDLIEGLYLLEKGVIRVVKPDGREVDAGELREVARSLYERFDMKYLVYRDLRDRGLVATPGIKYGCDFAVYRKGPGIDHAPYIVHVRSRDEPLEAPDVVRSGRLATTVRKTFITAIPNLEDGKVTYVGFRWWRP